MNYRYTQQLCYMEDGRFKGDRYYDSIYMTFGKIGAGTRWVVGQRWGKIQFFPRSSLGLALPAPTLLYPCLCRQPWIQYHEAYVSSTEKQTWSFSNFHPGSCRSAGISPGPLSLFLRGLCLPQAFCASASSYNSVFQREQAMGRHLSGCPLGTECCAGSIRILNHSGQWFMLTSHHLAVGNMRTIRWGVGRRGSPLSLKYRESSDSPAVFSLAGGSVC